MNDANIAIRCMHLDDIARITAIEQQVYDDPWPAIAFNASLQKNYPAWVLLSDNEISGYALATHVQDEAHIINFAIDPQHQRQGLGRQLLAFVLATLQDAHVRTISLEVRKDNDAAIALYQAQGFTQQGLRKAYYQTSTGRVDALILVKSV